MKTPKNNLEARLIKVYKEGGFEDLKAEINIEIPYEQYQSLEGKGSKGKAQHLINKYNL